MRHFSELSPGVRLLMEDELEKVAGGDGEDTDDVAGAATDFLRWLTGLLPAPPPPPPPETVVLGIRG